jgi:hypothetical protein
MVLKPRQVQAPSAHTHTNSALNQKRCLLAIQMKFIPFSFTGSSSSSKKVKKNFAMKKTPNNNKKFNFFSRANKTLCICL